MDPPHPGLTGQHVAAGAHGAVGLDHHLRGFQHQLDRDPVEMELVLQLGQRLVEPFLAERDAAVEPVGLLDTEVVPPCRGAVGIRPGLEPRGRQIAAGEGDAGPVEVIGEAGVLLHIVGQARPLHQLERLGKPTGGLRAAAGVQQDVAQQLGIAAHVGGVGELRIERILPLDLPQRRVRLPRVHQDDALGEERGAPVGVVAGLAVQLVHDRRRLGVSPLVHPVARDTHPRRREVAVHRQGLPVLGNRFVEPARLHQQLGVRVVRVGIARDQLDVFEERPRGVVVLPERAVGIAQEIVRGRKARIELDGRAILPNRIVVLLAAEQRVAQEKVGPLVRRVLRHELPRVVECLRGIGVPAGLERQNHQPLTLRDPVGERGRLLHMLEEVARGRRVGRELIVRHGERRVPGRCLAVQLAAVVRPELLGAGAAFQVEPPGVGGGGGEGDRALVGAPGAGGGVGDGGASGFGVGAAGVAAGEGRDERCSGEAEQGWRQCTWHPGLQRCFDLNCAMRWVS